MPVDAQNDCMTSTLPGNPPAPVQHELGTPVPGVTLRLAAVTAGLILAVTVLLFGSVLVLGLTVPAVRSHILTVLAITDFVHAALVLAVEGVVLGRRRELWQDLGITRPSRRLLHLLWQIPAAIVILLVVQGVALLLMGDNGSATDGVSEFGLGPAPAILLFIGAAVLTPLWEEIFFRGVLFAAVGRKWGMAWAVIGSAVVFSAVHGVPILLPYLFTMGVILALLRLFHRNIWGGLALHMTINVIASSAVLVALV